MPQPALSARLGAGGIASVVWATGFRPDLPFLRDVDVLDRRGRIRHDGGVTAAPGLYVVGLPFLRRRRSTLIDGAAADSRELADHLLRPPRHRRTAGELRRTVMQHHPVAAAVATIIAARDPQRLARALTATARLRALLPGGPIAAHGRDDVAACFHRFFADFDTVRLVESAGEAVADRLLVHYRLHVTQGATRWVCTQTAICKFAEGRLGRRARWMSAERDVSGVRARSNPAGVHLARLSTDHVADLVAGRPSGPR